ncbi:hypothetical protein JC2156_04300 [Weissella koreensis KCTC 3621]|uniref:phage tail sheath family protein n=1 Tax=Weissella koreensis TaxID=165096 RepID=UPI00026F364B|nr:phage tail sheath family protein [Weissella koreensis]EJF33720.1 hypothetical protein JC2156_05340 [Weissella koreensis KCTC 3621]EJF34122.1 hypothetical protein JC2156_04300 [Weissella koreensis KCTC 3621]
MAGGNWKDQNKKLPGTFINVRTAAQNPVMSDGDRGTVLTLLSGLNWGPEGIVEVNKGTDFISALGHDLTDDALTGIRMILANANKVLIFNVNPGVKATGTAETIPWKFEAKFNGAVGNDVAVTVASDANDATKAIITTTFKGALIDKQSARKASEFNGNNFVVATVKLDINDDGLEMISNLVTPVAIQMSGGAAETSESSLTLNEVSDTTATVNIQEYSTGDGADPVTEFQKAMDTYEFNVVVAANSSDKASINRVIAAGVERLRDEQGRKVMAVVPASAGVEADYEGVISLGNALVFNDLKLTQAQSAGWVAGATAAAESNQSLTYRQVNGATDVDVRFTEEQAISAINDGQMLFTASRGAVKVLEDINSLHTFTDDKGKAFSKNRVMRVVDDIANWVRINWEDNYIGKITNNSQGRDLFKSAIATKLTDLQTAQAIQDFAVEDITIAQGNDKDSVVVGLAVTPTDAMEKLYMDVVAN